jgi:hypothetical protein
MNFEVHGIATQNQYLPVSDVFFLMHAKSIYLICLAVTVIMGCRGDSRAELFEVNQVVDFTIQAGLNTADTHFYSFGTVQSEFQQELAAKGLDAKNVASVEPKFAELSTVFADEDLDFIRQFTVRLFDPFNPDYSREIFYLDPVPNNTKKVMRPFPGLSDVKDLINNPIVGVEVRVAFRWVTPRSYDMRLEFDLSAKAQE